MMSLVKRITATISGLILSLFVAAPAFAQGFLCPTGEGGFSALCNLKGDQGGFTKILSTGITLAFIAAVVIALFFLIWGGIKWILSGGDKGGVEAARNTIVAAIIGLIVTFAAYFILNLVLGFFGLSLDNIKLPKFI